MKKITLIEPQKRRKHRYNLYINNSFYLGIDESVIVKCSLSVGKEVSDEFLENIVKTEELTKAFNTAMSSLSFRARSTKEIEKKLKEKGYDPLIINQVIERLSEYGYLNDVAFAESFIKEKQNFKKAGKRMLKRDLYQKGIEKETIDQLIEDNVSDEDEYERALELALKKSSSFSTNENRNSKYRKLSGLLARKGYSYDIISKVIRKVLSADAGDD